MLKPTCLLFGLALLTFAGTGCVTQKQSWEDWMAAARAKPPGPPIEGRPLAAADVPTPVFREGYTTGDGARVGPGVDLAMRNPDFPETHISAVYIDLTRPNQFVHVKWTGPSAALGPEGPWHSSPGRGKPCVDCNDEAGSNTVDSWCTPKGVFKVAGFDDRLPSVPYCKYVTWVVYKPRFIAMHSHTNIPRYAGSHGCIRLPEEAAKLIHNNSIAGVTLVCIEGTWVRPVGPFPDR